MYVFVLMEEDYGGMFSSHLRPIGKAFTEEQEAIDWVDGKRNRAYAKVEVVEVENEHGK